MLCHLLGIRSAADLRSHPLRGAIFESFVLSELRKQFLHQGERPPLSVWRDTHGHEVDVLIDLGSRRIPLEIKSGETVASDAFANLDFYCQLSGERGVSWSTAEHSPTRADPTSSAPGGRARDQRGRGDVNGDVVVAQRHNLVSRATIVARQVEAAAKLMGRPRRRRR